MPRTIFSETSSIPSREGFEAAASIPDAGTENFEFSTPHSHNETFPIQPAHPVEHWSPETVTAPSTYAIRRKPVPKESRGSRSESSAADSLTRTETASTERSFAESVDSADCRDARSESLVGGSRELVKRERPSDLSVGFDNMLGSIKIFREALNGTVGETQAGIGLLVILLAWFWIGSFPWSDRAMGLTPSSPIIALMGETGAGKSSFIKILGGRDENGQPPLVGHSLNSTTKAVTWYSAALGNRGFYLLDTPGFDDSFMSDFEILEGLTSELARIYKAERPINGVIYVHNISKKKMGGTSHQSLRTFQKLVGDRSLESVVLVTTHWPTFFKGEQIKREEELRKTFWASMLARGSNIMRHDGSKKSALKIVGDILKKKPVVMKIVDEMVNKKLKFADTEAGSLVAEGLHVLEGKLDVNMAALNDEISELKEEQKRILETAAAEKERLEKEMMSSTEQQKAEIAKLLEELKKKSEGQMEKLNQQLEHGNKEKRTLSDEIQQLRDANKKLQETIEKQNTSGSGGWWGKKKDTRAEPEQLDVDDYAKVGDPKTRPHLVLTFCFVLVLFHGIGLPLFSMGVSFGVIFFVGFCPVMIAITWWCDWSFFDVVLSTAAQFLVIAFFGEKVKALL
ncbi:hypothetical protein ABW19_dt0207651 [Dactylella cylindrospora]|nr:hypothetical protein ABW19_dt0207651 [Dactylella cylindrospora]